MITLNKLVYDIKNIAYGGTQSDDSAVSDRQVAYWINQLRADLIDQTMKANRSIPDVFVQHIECINLECIDAVECCDVSLSSNERLLKSTQKIPLTIQRSGKNTIVSVSSIDKTVGFAETSYYRQKFNKYNKFTGSKPRWFLRDDYLYVINDKLMETISLSGVFEDPTEAIEFLKCDGEACWNWDSAYPITNKISNVITNIVIKEKLGLAIQAPRDDANDGRGQTETSTHTNEQD